MDAGSTYEPNPLLTYQWDPTIPPAWRPSHQSKKSLGAGKQYDLGYHPADPMAVHFSPTSPTEDGHTYQSPEARKEVVPGQEMWAYVNINGGYVYLLYPASRLG